MILIWSSAQILLHSKFCNLCNTKQRHRVSVPGHMACKAKWIMCALVCEILPDYCEKHYEVFRWKWPFKCPIIDLYNDAHFCYQHFKCYKMLIYANSISYSNTAFGPHYAKTSVTFTNQYAGCLLYGGMTLVCCVLWPQTTCAQGVPHSAGQDRGDPAGPDQQDWQKLWPRLWSLWVHAVVT